MRFDRDTAIQIEIAVFAVFRLLISKQSIPRIADKRMFIRMQNTAFRINQRIFSLTDFDERCTVHEIARIQIYRGQYFFALRIEIPVP
ncbi:hypothetical protein D3C81_1889060 [compost metagenome]